MDNARVQRLVTLLTEYNDVVVHAGPIRHNALEFWLNGKRIIHQFSSQGDAEAHLRATLGELGARPKQSQAEPLDATNIEIETTRGESSAMPVNELPNAVLERVEPEEVFVDAAEPKAQPIPDVQPVVRTNNEQGVATVYRSSRVIAIEIEQDLIILKGHMLVIPLNRPNTLIDMVKEQFEALFETAEIAEIADVIPDSPFPEPVPEPLAPLRPSSAPQQVRKVATDENFENDILIYLRQRKGAVKARVIANALHRPIYRTELHLRALLGRGVVECPQTGFWALVKATATPSPPPVNRTGPVKLSKVPPQLTRILAAMAFAAKTTGRLDLTSRDVTPHLPERDARQYGARIPGAIQKGLVERGLPLPDSRGSHYRLTPLGLSAIKEFGAAAFENEDLPIPDWLVHL